MTARIAARNLTPVARAKIVAILRATANDDLGLLKIVGAKGAPQPPDSAIETALATIAIWPDHIPGGKKETGPWHFIDIGLFEDPSTALAVRCKVGGADDACISRKIEEIVGNLRINASLPGQDRTFAPDRELRFLVHFLGDIHQPLHTATDADAVANCIITSGFSEDRETEMHGVWDTSLVKLVAGASPDPAADIIDALRSQTAAFQKTTDPKAITVESFNIAKNNAYPAGRPRIPVIGHFVDVQPSACKTEAPPQIVGLRLDGQASFNTPVIIALVRQQLFKGGVRLAAILNSL